MDEQVRLPDLEVIRRYSIAVRREHAPAEEVLTALKADLEAVMRAVGGRRTRTTRSTRAPARRSTRTRR